MTRLTSPAQYEPVIELTRGEIVESIHSGAVAVVTKDGELYASCGDPELVTYMRSSAKPFQVLPLVEAGGMKHFGFSLAELALMCASHSGTETHTSLANAIQEKAGVGELDLMCGIHPPTDENAAEALRKRGESPTPNHNNCSGKHSGMLALARLKNWPVDHYIDPIHPVQQLILQVIAEMCAYPMEEIELGIDGCSAPNFALPIQHAAQGFARLMDPIDLPEERANACRTIVQAMTSHPEMIAGPGRFDTLLMQATGGRLLTKGGAEGYQAVGIPPGVLSKDSPALGVAVKIADGDPRGRARPAVVLEVLRQLGALDEAELKVMQSFGPASWLYNWRKLTVGESRPVFSLTYRQEPALPRL
jgi:L-asparaginase II